MTDAEEIETRDTFKGSADLMTQAMLEVAVIPDFVEYEVKSGKDDGKTAGLQKDPILKVKGMWQQLHKLQNNCCFSKSKWDLALRGLHEAKKDIWPRALTEKEQNEWRAVIKSRLHLQARHIGTAMRTNPENDWLLKLWDPNPNQDVTSAKVLKRPASASIAAATTPVAKRKCTNTQEATGSNKTGTGKPADEKDSPAEKDNDDSGDYSGDRPVPKTTFHYGFCRESKQAWRAPSSDVNKKEFSTTIFIGAAKKDDDFVKARFKDGNHIIHDLCVAELRAMRLVERDAQRSGPLVEQYHARTRNRYFATYVRRDDRLTVWKQVDGADNKKKEQKSMVVVGWFKDSDADKEDENARADQFDKASVRKGGVHHVVGWASNLLQQMRTQVHSHSQPIQNTPKLHRACC